MTVRPKRPDVDITGLLLGKWIALLEWRQFRVGRDRMNDCHWISVDRKNGFWKLITLVPVACRKRAERSRHRIVRRRTNTRDVSVANISNRRNQRTKTISNTTPLHVRTCRWRRESQIRRYHRWRVQMITYLSRRHLRWPEISSKRMPLAPTPSPMINTMRFSSSNTIMAYYTRRRYHCYRPCPRRDRVARSNERKRILNRFGRRIPHRWTNHRPCRRWNRKIRYVKRIHSHRHLTRWSMPDVVDISSRRFPPSVAFVPIDITIPRNFTRHHRYRPHHWLLGRDDCICHALFLKHEHTHETTFAWSSDSSPLKDFLVDWSSFYPHFFLVITVAEKIPPRSTANFPFAPTARHNSINTKKSVRSQDFHSSTADCLFFQVHPSIRSQK